MGILIEVIGVSWLKFCEINHVSSSIFYNRIRSILALMSERASIIYNIS